MFCTNRIITMPFPPNAQLSLDSRSANVVTRKRPIFAAFQGILDRDDGGVRGAMADLAQFGKDIVVVRNFFFYIYSVQQLYKLQRIKQTNERTNEKG